MGYTTDFEGHFEVTPPLEIKHADYLARFSGTRRMRTDGQPSLWCQWVPISDSFEPHRMMDGPDQEADAPAYYPYFGWDGGEKFYNYVEWLEYIVSRFLKPWGYALNGEVTWQGEERADIGKIVVENNQISTKAGRIEWE